MKLTKNQIVACNVVDGILRWHSQNDIEGADHILAAHVMQHSEYVETGDRECLHIAKNYINQLYEIFRKAKEEWNE